MTKIVFGLLAIVAGLILSAACICVAGGIVATLIAYFTTGVISLTVGACVAFTIKSAIAVVISLLCYIALAATTAG